MFKAGVGVLVFSYHYYVMLYVMLFQTSSRTSHKILHLWNHFFSNLQLRKCLLVSFKSDHYFPSPSAYSLTQKLSTESEYTGNCSVLFEDLQYIIQDLILLKGKTDQLPIFVWKIKLGLQSGLCHGSIKVNIKQNFSYQCRVFYNTSLLDLHTQACTYI